MNDRPDWLPASWVVAESMQGASYLDEDGAVHTEAEARAALARRVPVEGAENASRRHPAPVPAPVHSWQDSDPEALVRALAIRKTNRDNLMAWIRDALIEGTDFGRIHVVKKDQCPHGNRCTIEGHYSKPTLWKAGAEKICGMLGLVPTWPDLEDTRSMLLGGKGSIVLRCLLINAGGRVLSEGIGARDLQQDYGVMNKALKMAKKSSLIDAVLNAAGVSEVFTQDLVDDDSPGQAQTLDEDGVRYLRTAAVELFGDKAEVVLASLARRRFRIADGDPYQIPAYRLQDAIRSLEEKAAEVDADNQEAE